MKNHNPRRRMFIVNDPQPLIVSRELAVEIGLNEALFLQQIEFWISIGQNVKDGSNWTYQSLNNLKRCFPFLSVSTIQRTIKSLERQGLIKVTDRYRKSALDKRRWFALNYKGLNNLESITIESLQNDATLSHFETSWRQNDVTWRQNDVTLIRNTENTAENTYTAPHGAGLGGRDARIREGVVGDWAAEDQEACQPTEPSPLSFWSDAPQAQHTLGRAPAKVMPAREDGEQGRLFATGKRQVASLPVSEGKNSLAGRETGKAAGSKVCVNPIPQTAFQQMYRICFLASNEPQRKLLTKAQCGQVAGVLGKMRDAGIDLTRLTEFELWWAKNWRSGKGNYQAPRPIQVQELWSEAMAARDAAVKPKQTTEDKEAQTRLREAMLKRAGSL